MTKKLAQIDGNNPMTGWRVPAHVIAQAQKPDRAQENQAKDALRAHSLMLSAEGSLYPVVLTGYLSDPQVPLSFMTEASGGSVQPAARADWGRQDAFLSQIDVHSAATPGAEFNPFGSLLAADLGFELEPLYGHVFFCRTADQNGIIGKLSVELKETMRFKLLSLHSVIEQVRPDYMDEEQYTMVWARLKLLVDEHRTRSGLTVGPANR